MFTNIPMMNAGSTYCDCFYCPSKSEKFNISGSFLQQDVKWWTQDLKNTSSRENCEKSGEKTFICDWKLLHEKLHFTVVQFHLQEQQLALDSVIYWFIAGVAYLRGFSNGLFVLLSAHPLCWHSHITLTALYTSLQLETSNPASGILTFTAFSTATKQWGLLCIFKNTL